MLRRSVEHVASQKAYEAEVKTRLDAARKLRQEEKEKQDAAQKALLILDQKHAEEVAERRRKLRAEAESWASRAKEESEEEEEKRADKARKAAARKAKQEANPSGDEAAEGKKEKKRRRIKTKKEKHTGEEAEAVFSPDEAMDETPDGADRPKKVCAPSLVPSCYSLRLVRPRLERRNGSSMTTRTLLHRLPSGKRCRSLHLCA
jgi:RNA polymerase-associated protein CTR9